MHLRLSFFVLLFCINCCFSQQYKIVKVVDQTTGFAIPYVSLYSTSKQFFLVGNETGLIAFANSSILSDSDTVTISSTGYSSVVVSVGAIKQLRNDTTIIHLKAIIEELPEVVLKRINLSEMLDVAFKNSFIKYMPYQEASVFYRISRQTDDRFTGIFEGLGKRFENGISLQMAIGSRTSHYCDYLTEIRSTGFNTDESAATIYPNLGSNFVFLNYFLRYAFPFNHELYKKKLNRSINDDDGILVVDLEPDLSNNLLIRAGKRVSPNYGNIFNSKRRYFINLNDTTISSISLLQENVGKVGWSNKFILNRSEMEFRFRKQDKWIVLTYASEKRNISSVNNKNIQFTEFNEAFFFDVTQKNYTDQELMKKYYLTSIDRQEKGMLRQYGSSNYSSDKRFLYATPSHLTENPSFWKSYTPPAFNYEKLKKDLHNNPYIALF